MERKWNLSPNLHLITSTTFLDNSLLTQDIRPMLFCALFKYVVCSLLSRWRGRRDMLHLVMWKYKWVHRYPIFVVCSLLWVRGHLFFTWHIFSRMRSNYHLSCNTSFFSEGSMLCCAYYAALLSLYHWVDGRYLKCVNHKKIN